VLLAGVSYKRDVDDIRESPALDLLSLLRERGATLAYSDPYVPKLSGSLWPNGVDLYHVDLATAPDHAYDCIVVVADHSAFDYDRLQRAAKVVVDTRNAISSPGPHVVRLGAPRQAGVAEFSAVPS
jgi:UDP-N-acetyl-D-glucosamine dehydrogenase